MSLVISSPFCTFKKKKAVSIGETEYVRHEAREVINDGFDPEHPDCFTTSLKLVEVSRDPISDYVNSFASSVGLKNLLKGVISKKQLDDMISRTSAAPGDIDITGFPTSELELEKLAGSVDKIWESIPVDLRGNLTKEDFVKSITASQIQKYVQSQVAAQEVNSQEGDQK